MQFIVAGLKGFKHKLYVILIYGFFTFSKNFLKNDENGGDVYNKMARKNKVWSKNGIKTKKEASYKTSFFYLRVN